MPSEPTLPPDRTPARRCPRNRPSCTVGERFGGNQHGTETLAVVGCPRGSRTARRNLSVAARTTMLPSISVAHPSSASAGVIAPGSAATWVMASARRCPRAGAGDVRNLRHLRVVLDRHGRQGELALLQLMATQKPSEADIDRLIAGALVMSARSRRETRTRPVGDFGGDGLLRGHLVVEAGDSQAVATGLMSPAVSTTQPSTGTGGLLGRLRATRHRLTRTRHVRHGTSCCVAALLSGAGRAWCERRDMRGHLVACGRRSPDASGMGSSTVERSRWVRGVGGFKFTWLSPDARATARLCTHAALKSFLG